MPKPTNNKTFRCSLGFPLDNHLADLVQAAGHSVSLPLLRCLYNGSGSSRPRLRLRMRTPALGLSASCGCGTVQDHGSDLGKETSGCAGTRFIVLYISLWNIYTSLKTAVASRCLLWVAGGTARFCAPPCEGLLASGEPL